MLALRPSRSLRTKVLSARCPTKVFLVTGANAGIGLETVKALALTGATVYGTVRSTESAQKALSQELQTGRVHLIHMKLDNFASIKAAAQEFLTKSGGKLNVLIENAGVILPSQEKTDDGFEKIFGVSHVGHFLLFQLLKDALLATSTPAFNSRVVVLTSAGHKHIEDIRFHDYNWEENGSFDNMKAYGQAKLANVWFANQLERLYATRGLHAVSVHPGIAITELPRNLPREVVEQGVSIPGIQEYLKSAEQAAATTTICAVGRQFEGVGGRYCEDCDWAVHYDEARVRIPEMFVTGYGPHTYNREGEEKLWEESLKMIAKA